MIATDGTVYVNLEAKVKVDGALLAISASEQTYDVHYAAVGEGGAVLVSRDDGETWERPMSPPVPEDLMGVRLSCGKEPFALAVGAAGRIIRGDDLGVWEPIASPVNTDLHDVAIIGTDVAVAVGEAGVVVRSVDGGRNWHPIMTGSETDLASVGFESCDSQDLLQAQEVQAIRGLAVGIHGTALFSADSGASWEPLALGVDEDLRQVRINVFGHPGLLTIDAVMVGDTRLLSWSQRDGVLSTVHDFGAPILWIGSAVPSFVLVIGDGMRYVYEHAHECTRH